MIASNLRSLTYVSRPTAPMSELEFTQLGLEAGRLNALDGITGLLAFNGERFCQTIEGSREALDSLLDRLSSDSRHSDLQILADETIDQRSFRSWDMQLLTVPDDCRSALAVASSRLDSQVDLAARTKIYETVEGLFA
jgi:hypothetical protein